MSKMCKNGKKCVINFNHIDKTLSEDTLKKFMELYYFYHKLATCMRWQYKKLNKQRLILNMTSIGLTVVGTIAGGLTLNPLISGVVAGPGILIQGYIVKSSLNSKVRDYKRAYISYNKILTELRDYLRGTHFNETAFLSNIKVIDDQITDLGLTTEKMSRKYLKRYEL